MRELAQRLLRGERAALAAFLNRIDDCRPGRREAALLHIDELCRAAPQPGAARVGITGPPGVGKSTLLDAVVRALRRRGERVAVIAIDPSSRRSGGALLGDRARMRSLAGDEGVLVRSMAARDRLGGLADATWPTAVTLTVAFDWVFIETLGVGQAESEVAQLVDSLVYVAQPGAGDTLQFMKAGLLEHPDLVVVNKADRRATAERTARELATSLALAAREPGAGGAPEPLLTSARDGWGIDALIAALDRHGAELRRRGAQGRQRRDGERTLALEHLERRYGSYGLGVLGGSETLVRRMDDEPERSALFWLVTLSRECERAFREASPEVEPCAPS